jgi:Zn-finger nucleic acid-binding protein
MGDQPAVEACPRCGVLVRLEPRSPWEFDLICRCGEWVTVAYARKAAPPTFERVPGQPALF